MHSNHIIEKGKATNKVQTKQLRLPHNSKAIVAIIRTITAANLYALFLVIGKKNRTGSNICDGI